jgi:hypothetical protein
VCGLALRSDDARPSRTAPRPLCSDLDALPFAHRYRAPARHLGLAFRPVWGSRGCWGSCAFCAITTYYRDAHAYGGGKKLRLRSVESLASEMAALWHAEGDTTLFCFHDETLLMPRPVDSIARLTALRRELDALGVGQIGIIGKCRPDSVTPELAKELRRLGVIRMFVGVENGAQRGLDHLGRRTTLQQVEDALAAYEAAGIFVCYNLLLFEPDCVLDDVRENIEFIRRHAHIPVNFCRAEPYHGTPLYHRVRERGTLMGSYLGWDYRIHDDRAEQAFRVAAAVFRERNFDAEGVANRTMGLGYTTQLLRCFFNVNSTRGQQLLERVDQITRDVTQDTAMFLEQALDIAQACDLADHDRIARETALLGLRVSAHNRVAHALLDSVVSDICACADSQPRKPQGITIPDRVRSTLERMTVAGCFAASLQACGGSTSDNGGDPAPASGGHSGTQIGVTGGAGGFAPTGSRNSGGQVVDMVPSSGGRSFSTGDPLPSTGGRLGTGGRASGGMVYDMVPSTGGMLHDPLPPTGGRLASGGAGPTGGKSYLIQGGADTIPPSGGRVGSGGKGSGGIYGDGGAGPLGGKSSGDTLPNAGGKTATGGRGSGGMLVDMVPFSGGRSATGGNAFGGMVIDCVVNAAGVGDLPALVANVTADPRLGDESSLVCTVDPAPPECTAGATRGHAVVENWRDSGPRRLVRSQDLALYDPPSVHLEAVCEARRIRVQLHSDDANLSIRWQSEGQVQGEGPTVYWTPANEDDSLCVAVRGAGGITVATLRAADIPERIG